MQKLTATGIYSDGSKQDIASSVAWSSSATAVAAINAGGTVTALSSGPTTVTAADGNITGGTTLTVTAAQLVSIGITPAAPSNAVGTMRTLKATGVYSDHSFHDVTDSVSWQSATPTVAVVDPAGQATALRVGATLITATLGGVTSPGVSLKVTGATLVSIVVTRTRATIAKGTQQQFNATGTYSDRATQDLSASVVWLSSAPDVATIGNTSGSNGLAKATGVGSTSISAAAGGVTSPAVTLTVSAATLVSIAVSPPNSPLPLGLTLQLTSTGTYTDKSTQDLTGTVTWTSSATTVADVSSGLTSSGLVTSHSVGSTNITAKLLTVNSAPVALAVTAARLVSIAITPANPRVEFGFDQPFTAAGTYTDNSIQDLTSAVSWVSTDTAVASISNASSSNGLAASLSTGTTGILAALGAVTGATSLTVTVRTWTLAGSMTHARDYHTATLLPNGTVLVTGGNDSSDFMAIDALSSAELYDPSTGLWTATGSMNTARYTHTATLLPNGTVLVAGGDASSGLFIDALPSAEIYDPSTGLWTATGSMNTARYNHSATLLQNGTVLVAGGLGSSGALSSAEIYDPSTGIWASSGSLNTAREYQTATLLPNGTVLVAGGAGSGGALGGTEIYDPSAGTWTVSGSLNAVRFAHCATLLPDGTVLAAGGQISSAFLSSAEIYDPGTGSWTLTASLNTERTVPTAVLLPNGTVLVAGGASTSGVLAGTEIYDPGTSTWTVGSNLNTARIFNTTTLLQNGTVLVVAGTNSNTILTSAEVY